MRHFPSHSGRAGFTVVETVVVLILLGILSVTALARLTEPTAYAPLTLSNSIHAHAQYAAQLAQSRADIVRLNVTTTATERRLVVTTGAVEWRATELQRGATAVDVLNAGAQYSLITGVPLVVEFATNGRLASGDVAGSALDPGLGIGIRATGSSVHQICLQPTGYVSNGSC